MKSTSKLDVALKAAFDGYRQDWCAALPNGGAVALSPATTQKMQRQVRRRAKVYYPLFGTTARRVASVVVALFIAMNAVVLNVESLQQGLVRMVTKITEDWTNITFENKGEAVKVPFEKKTPQYLPESYHIKDEEERLKGIWQEYVGFGGHFTYDQSMHNGNALKIKVNTNYVQPTDITINGLPGIIFTSITGTQLLFYDDIYVYHFSGSDSISWSEYVKMAESIS